MHEKYLALSEAGSVKHIKSLKDLNFATDRDIETMSLFSVEGGGGLFAESAELITLFESGLRIFGFAWDKNELSASASELADDDFGLTKDGIVLAKRLEEMGIVPDVSHMSDRAVFDLFGTVDSPIIATHSNFRAICKSRRNLADTEAREIARRGGLIGINFYPHYLSERGDADIYDVIRHIDYGLDLVGENAIALGLDIDGTDGFYPRGFGEKSSIHDALFDALSKKYKSSILEKIFGGNVLNFLKNVLK